MLETPCLNSLQYTDSAYSIFRTTMEQLVTAQHDETFNACQMAPQPLTVTDCADAVIREIASYLPFKSYSNFQSICRSIFYAAKSPSTLYELNCGQFSGTDLAKCFDTENMHQIQLFMKRFEKVQKLSYWFNSFESGEYIPLIKFKNLQYLEIYPDAEEAEQYLSRNTFSWDTIRHLGIAGRAGEEDLSFEIINRCKHIKPNGWMCQKSVIIHIKEMLLTSSIL
eukprot:920224_1